MQSTKCALTAKRVPLIIVSITVLIMTVMWAFGIRFEHLQVLRLLYSEPMELSVQETTEVHEWLQNNTIDLKTVDAGSGFDDMMPLKDMVADARIVSLGENAHLNGDFYKVKHRMVEFLVSEMEFTLFAIEAPFGCASKINEYLLGGDVRPQEALEELVYKVWRTEEILNMLIWMREYNATHDKKVTFYGFDSRPVFRCAEVVYRFLRKGNGTKEYDDILLEWITFKFDRYDTDNLKNIIGEVRELISYLEGQCPTASHDQKEWEFALQNSRVLLQHVEHFLTMPNRSKASDIRDKHMAENVKWLMDYEEGNKAILWAANPHITILPGSGCMGAYLRRMYGDDMVVIGLICGRRGSFEQSLARAGLEISVLDFRSQPDGIVSEYLNSPFRSDQWVKTIYPISYDAVLYIRSTSGARMIRKQEFLFRRAEM